MTPDQREAYRQGMRDAAEIAEMVEVQQDVDHGSANTGGAAAAASAIRARISLEENSNG